MRKKSVWLVFVLASVAILAVVGAGASDVTSGPAVDAIGTETADVGNPRPAADDSRVFGWEWLKMMQRHRLGLVGACGMSWSHR